MRTFLEILIIFLGFFLSLHFDATSKPFQQPDTLKENQPADTLKETQKKPKSGLEGPVKYSADKISFSVDGRKTFLWGDVHIDYENISLDAGKVTINWDQNNMIATGIVDSTDSLGNEIYKSLPVFKEKGNEPIHGSRLEYDFKNQRGKVLSGRTEMAPGYYQGDRIKKVGEKTLFVEDGYFTSCDRIENPHYYFKASKMRIKMGERAVAKPIVMYIADVPIFAVPFGVFPMQRGRRSGIIIPTFGESSFGGRNLRNFGFYWAASQYWDATILASFFERTGVAYEGELRYRKRYSFSGNVNGRFAPKDVTTGEKRQRWSLNFRHNQTLSETMNLNASGSFVSDKQFLQDISHNQQDRLNQLLTTNATLSKRWPSSKNSITASVSRDENLQNGNLSYTFPRLAFSHTQSNLIPYDPQKTRDKKWYHDIYYDYNSNFVSSGSKRLQSDSTFLKQTELAWRHSGSLSFNHKIFNYIKYNQSARFEELWVPEYLDHTFVDSLNNTVADTVSGFRARHTFNTSIGAATTIYGLFELPFSPIKIIRHKMDPRISFSFSPDFTDPSFGYAQTFRDTTGQRITRDRFAGNPFGGTSSSESRRMNISISNLFQGKMMQEGEEKKIDLFTLNFSSSYNFIADSLKWSNIRSSLRASASRNFDFSVSTTHSFYKAGHSGRGSRNEFVWEDGFGLPRLLRVQLNARVHLKPPEKKEEEKPDTTEGEVPGEAYEEGPTIGRDPLMEGLKDFKLPWDLTANFNYSLDRSDINNVRQRFDVNLSGRIELTPNWRVQYNANIDLIKKQINYQSFNIYRDLHCWEMSFAWGPNPQGYSFFTLEIRIKESALRDIKLSKSSAGRRVY